MRAFVFGAVVLVAQAAWANEPATPCQGHVLSPDDGATDVPLDVAPLAQLCGGLPQLTDDLGRSIELRTAPDEQGTRLTPVSPLASGRTYTLTVGPPIACTDRPARISFRTVPAPAVSAIRWDGGDDTLDLLEVVLSEPVADTGELLPSAGFVTVERTDGPTPTADEVAEWNLRTVAGRYFKKSDMERPLTSTWRVHVKKELHFASGASLAGDFDEEIVPADFPFGWKPGATKADCPSPASGCSCSTAEGGAVLLLALVLRRRR